jgi:hypothetical protein
MVRKTLFYAKAPFRGLLLGSGRRLCSRFFSLLVYAADRPRRGFRSSAAYEDDRAPIRVASYSRLTPA